MEIILISSLVLIVLLIVIFRKMRKNLETNTANADLSDMSVLEIKVPRSGEVEDPAPLAAEHMFAALHGLLHQDYSLQEHFTFELASSSSTGIKFYCVVPTSIKSFVESQIYAQYPTAQIIDAEDYTGKVDTRGEYSVANLALAAPQYFPIKTFRDFEVDPLSAVTAALTQLELGENLWFQLLIRPIPDIWQQEGHDYVKATIKGEEIGGGGFSLAGSLQVVANEMLQIFAEIPKQIISGPGEGVSLSGGGGSSSADLSSGQELQLKAIENKLSKIGFEVNIRLVSHAQTQERADKNLRSLTASMKQFSVANLNSFVSISEPNKGSELDNYKNRTFDFDKSFILTTDELASVYHLPSGHVETPNIDWVLSKKSEPPATLPKEDCTFLGETLFRSQRVRFGIKNGDDRLRHMYLIGKTGTGKTTFFKNMIIQDIANGFGVGILDPHGELIEDMLEYIPDHRLEDVIIIDPSDSERPVGINLLEIDDPSQKNLMASALVSAIKIHFDYSWGPRLEYLLNNAVLTLLDVPGTSILGITRLLSDTNYQNYILHQVKDPVIMEFWDKEYKKMKGNQRLVTEAVAPIENKINRFLSSTTIRNILGQRKSTIDFWDAMNSNKIILVNLSKGKIGTDNANLLGALIVSRIQFMALQRAKIPSKERVPFYLYVDEFQNFAGGDFESILSESRKYKLALHLTHQYTSQLPEQLQDAVFGNVGTIASFALGAPDARVLESEFEPFFDQQDIISLERFHIYLKLMIDGMTSQPFSARILLPWVQEDAVGPMYPQNREKVIEMSRQRYGTDREQVEDIIKRWIERPFDKGMAIAEENRAKKG